MSAYSDWKCGALSDDEYDFCCRREAAMDKAYEELDYHRSCADCIYKDKKVTEEPCCKCTEDLDRYERYEE